MSLFGGTPASSAPASGSLFGGTSTTPAAGGSSLFGAKPAANLFGGTPAASSAPGTAPAATSAPSLFGGSTATTTPAAGGSSLFGAKPATTSAPAGGLFGGGTATASSAPAAGGLFGAAPAASAAGGTSLFGGGATTTTSAPAAAAPAATSSLFGGTPASGAAAAPAATTTGTSTLFGGAPAATTTSTAPTGGASLFGAKPAGTTTFGGGLGGTAAGQQQQQQQQQAQPAVYIDASNLEKFHKFSECNEAMKNLLTMIEKGISDQIRASDEIATKFPSHKEAIESVPLDAELMERKLHTTKTFLASDQALLAQTEQQVKTDEVSTALSVRTLDLLRSYARPGYSGLPPPTLSTTLLPPPTESDITTNAGMINYFNKEAGNMESKLRIFVESVGEVEASLRSVESQAVSVEGHNSDGVKRNELAAGGGRQLNKALRSFNDALNDVGGRLVECKDKLRAVERRGR